MNKPVQVAGALVTGGLLFWPAHAEAPAAGAFTVTAAHISVSALQMHGVRSVTGETAEQRLKVLASYAADGTSPAGDGSAPVEGEPVEDEEAPPADDQGEPPASDGDSEAPAELDASDVVNEIPVTNRPAPASYAPEQGVTASEAAGEDRDMKFKFATGFDYSSGDYGATTDTKILFIPVSGQFETKSFKFKVTVPWLRIEGPSGVIPGEGGNVVVGDPGPVIENSGLGDIVAAATYKIPPLGESAPFIDLTAKVKFPTADEDKFLGTGAYDFTGQVDIFQAFGNLTVFGSFGYRVLGDPEFQCFDEFLNPIPCGELNNGFLASGGFAYKFNDAFSGGGILDWREASTDSSEDPFEVVPYVVWKVHDDWAVQAYGVFGFSEGSPDAGGGLQVIFTLD